QLLAVTREALEVFEAQLADLETVQGRFAGLHDRHSGFAECMCRAGPERRSRSPASAPLARIPDPLPTPWAIAARFARSCRLLEAEHRFDPVEPGRPPCQPGRRAHGASGEVLAGGRAVDQLETLAASKQQQCVIAGSVAAAERLHADRARR